MVIVLIALFLAQQPTGVIQQVFETSGQVDRIDRVGRNISITSAGVVSAPIYVGPDMPIFDQLNSGDVVTVRFYDAVIVEVTPGERMKPLEDTTSDAQKSGRSAGRKHPAADQARGDHRRPRRGESHRHLPRRSTTAACSAWSAIAVSWKA